MKRDRRRRTLGGVLCLGVWADARLSHHSFAMYDQTKVVTFTGVVTRFVSQPNHAEIHFVPLGSDRKPMRDADGKFVVMGHRDGGRRRRRERGHHREELRARHDLQREPESLEGRQEFRLEDGTDLQVPQGHAAGRRQALQLGARATPSTGAESSASNRGRGFGSHARFRPVAGVKPAISLAIQTHLWVIPTVQSIHIVAIGIVLSSVFMIDLRVFGWAGTDQTLAETTRRFAPWLWGALGVLFVTGVLMIVGEPVRELLSLSFWLKMALVGVGAGLAAGFQVALRRHEREWEASLVNRRTTKGLAAATFLVWCGVVILGRLIAYDYVWGSWSLAPPA